jgi:DNA segregation ATPase FtsK/SpoIIIE, S-DNA-T family
VSSLSKNRQRQILAILLAAFSALMAASLATFVRPVSGMPPWMTDNACGPVGAALSFAAVWAFGRFASFGVPLLAGGWAWNRLRDADPSPLIIRSLIGSLLVFELCVGFALAGWDRWTWSGGWGMATGLALQSALSQVGSWVVAGALFGVTALVASEVGFHWIGRFVEGLVSWFASRWQAWRDRPAPAPARTAKARAARTADAKAVAAPVVRRAGVVTDEAAEAAIKSRKRPEVQIPEPVETDRHNQIRLPLPGLRAAESKPKRPPAPKLEPIASSEAVNAAATDALPPLGLLGLNTQPEDLITAADLTSEAGLLVAKLNDFGIQGRVTEIHPGPVVTTFEFEPAAGVKVNQIVSREDDLALTLRAQRIRILAPIPGKGAVGVEIPNRSRRTVYLREVLSSTPYVDSDSALKIALGVDVVGQPFVYDLAKMPHVLVAGATGSGKSVCLNAIITGLLFQHGPQTLRLLMIDPKMLELSAYNGIPHLVMPVITEAKKASRALRWGVAEMEKRYKLMATCGARNIAGYNEKVAAGQVPATADDSTPPERLSYVVIVIDELADLMLTAPQEIEEPIARLAQMARAVGIHLVLATQRPSVDVITGVIKANFPSRIAFQVASKTDSRTVLDMNGAENLLGHGDMLFMPAGRPEPYRIHGCYVSEDETARVVDFWKAKLRAVPLAEGAVPAAPPLATRPDLSEADEVEGAEEGADDDALLADAARLVVSHQQGSTSLLQRRLKVGYSRAGRLMDQLEHIGVVGPFQGSKARDVLVDERWLEERYGA